MTRRFIDDIRAEIDSELPDNTTREISPADLRPRLQDMCDSLKQDEAVLSSEAAADLTVNLTGAWTRIDDLTDPPTLAYDTAIGNDPEFLKINQTDGYIEGTATAGFTYEALGLIRVDSQPGEVVEAAIAIDGAPGEFIASNAGTAGDAPFSLYLIRYEPSATSNAQFSIIVRARDGAASNVTISNRIFGLLIQPTNNP